MAVALVTGASRGIGAAVARTLAVGRLRRGRRLRVRRRRLPPTRWRRSRRLGRRAVAVQADVADEAQAQAMVEAAEEALGPLDAVVLNAGITRDGLAVRMSAEDWSAVIDTNLSGAFYTARPALRGMLRRRSGSIVAVSSVVGLIGNAGQVNYAAAKAGMLGMVRALAREAGSRGVRVNAVAPGYITTDMTAELSRRAARGPAGADAARPAGQPRRRGGGRRLPVLARPPPSSPAPPCRSTAGWRCRERPRPGGGHRSRHGHGPRHRSPGELGQRHRRAQRRRADHRPSTPPTARRASPAR